MGQYEDYSLLTTDPDNHMTQCQLCNATCIECDIASTNCSRCQGDEDTFSTNPNTAYLFRINTTWSECRTTCPLSTNTNTTKGWYGSISTMICYQCPGGCSACNIAITRNDIHIRCIDAFCSEGIACTACLLGYVLVSGKCVD